MNVHPPPPPPINVLATALGFTQIQYCTQVAQAYLICAIFLPCVSLQVLWEHDHWPQRFLLLSYKWDQLMIQNVSPNDVEGVFCQSGWRELLP